MKTSTKLLIVLFACLPLSMVAYAYLLKQQFNEGNFYQNINQNQPNYIFKSLPPFKHVVVDGNLYIVDESPLTRDPKIKIANDFTGTRTISIQYNQLIEFTTTKKEIGYNVLANFENIVKTKIKNDTLYISLFKLISRNAKFETYIKTENDED